MAALGRADQGPPSEVPLRYTVLMTPLHVGFLVLALPALGRLPLRRGRSIVFGLAGLLLVQQFASGLYVIRTGDAIRRTLADFDAGERRPEMETMVSARFGEAEAVSARLKADGLYQTRLGTPTAAGR
jgi:hypothetical protein